jgi:hypothetical protein
MFDPLTIAGTLKSVYGLASAGLHFKSAYIPYKALSTAMASYQTSGFSGAASTLGQYSTAASAAVFLDKHGDKVGKAASQTMSNIGKVMYQSSGNRVGRMAGR